MTTNHRIRILICDDDALFRETLLHCIKKHFDHPVEFFQASNGDEALRLVQSHPIDVLFLDIRMRRENEGLEYLPRLKEADSDLAVVMSSGNTDFPTVRSAVRLGAMDYIPKDFQADDLIHTLHVVLEKKRLLKEKEQSHFEVSREQKRHLLIGTSPQIQNLRVIIEKARNSFHNVLITGEMGTGKEVVARQLRNSKPDGSLEPFIAVDSATIQSNMAESILFGHEKGAFTGADRMQKGVFEEADGGTVYFDELANMPLEIQSKLLRVIQEKEFSRLGARKVIRSQFRVVCATNKNLEQWAQEGKFKADLLDRLQVIPITIPPLRDRLEDLPLLLEHFVRIHHRGSTPAPRFLPETVDHLRMYGWPGNIRELSNMVAYVLTLCEHPEVHVADLPPRFREIPRTSGTKSTHGFYEKLAEFEKTILAEEFGKSQGNISGLAMSLGMDRSHLYTKLKQHGIYAPQKRPF